MEYRCYLYTLVLVALTACGSTNTPESAGAALAEKKCACLQVEKATELAGYQSVLELMKTDPGLSREDAWKKHNEELDQVARETSRQQEMACEEEGKQLMEEIQLKYPREEDRNTIKNAAGDRFKICEREYKERRKAIKDEIEQLNAARSGPSNSMAPIAGIETVSNEQANILRVIDQMTDGLDTLVQYDRETAAYMKGELVSIRNEVVRTSAVSPARRKQLETLRRMKNGLVVTADSLLMSRKLN